MTELATLEPNVLVTHVVLDILFGRSCQEGTKDHHTLQMQGCVEGHNCKTLVMLFLVASIKQKGLSIAMVHGL